ncbi:MAG: LD-carboxypeptidase [Bacteroidales bacterium]
MITPPHLNENDTVGIVAPARSLSPAELKEAIELYKSWGLNVHPGDNLYKKHNQFAGTETERASDLQKMMDNPEIKAIFCARGGYGTIRVMEYLSFDDFCDNPKWLVGFSDITVLHSYITQKLEIKTLHAPMPYNINRETRKSQTTQMLKDILFGKTPGITWQTEPYKTVLHEIQGKLTGGNLSVLYSLRGTSYDIDTSDSILFIEDVDEYLYHIDRMMMNLKKGGKLSNLRALLVGGMTEMHDNETPFGQNAYEIIQNVTASYNYPVLFNFPGGHTKNNSPLIMGDTVSIVPESRNKIRMSFNA